MARNLTSDSRVEAAINLLAALTGAPDGRLPVAVACQNLTLSERQVEEVIGLLQMLADRRTGSRALIYRDHDDIVLAGRAGELAPLRLTSDEAQAVAQVLDRYKLDEQVRIRVERALMPTDVQDGADAVSLLAGDALFGGFYQQIIEAIQDGARCRMSYRADRDRCISERLIDPGFIEVAGDTAYLIAWDVDKNAQRRYRLDRMENVSLTEDSAERHPFQRVSPAQSLRETGSSATLSFPSRSFAEATGWAGLDADAGQTQPDGSFMAPVGYATESWLFDQVLATAGTVCIVNPPDLRDRFVTYAQNLLR